MQELTALKKGSETAFEKVYHQYHKKLFRFFLKRIKDHETARELTQEAFVKLWKGRQGLSVSFSVETQIFTIAGSTLVDCLRRQAHERRRLSRLTDTIQEDQHPLTTTSHKLFETADYLKVVVRDLPPARKKVFLLKMSSGYTNKEIASQLSISEKTVEDHVTKALRHIRSIVSCLLLIGCFHC
jgi:RNA polymerase sigma-70 factor (family 1)